MIILDTNVISELMHVSPDPNVLLWMDRQSRSSLWVTSISIFEVIFGLEIMASGPKQIVLRNAFEALLNKFADRIAQFDQSSALRAAELMASRQRKGLPRDLRDTMIAGIVLARHASLATRNVTHFADLAATVINPWTT
jgi:predicted nucleic acid-binding protein